LKFRVNQDVQVISLDESLPLPNTSHTVSEIIRLIDKGNLEVAGCQVISKAIEYLQVNMNELIFRKVM
jgi:hypothetical protein